MPTPDSHSNLPFANVSDDSLRERISELSAQINAATYEQLLLVAELDRREAWRDDGMTSCAHWLAWRCGLGMIAAREKVRVARALESLPSVSEAFRRGELSYCKARALTRIADPYNEDELLALAGHATGAQTERIVRGVRFCQRNGELDRARSQHAERSVSIYHDVDGSVVMAVRLTAEAGARMENALRAAVDDRGGQPRHRPDLGPGAFPERITFCQRRADALLDIADHYLDTRGNVAQRPATSGNHNRYEVVVHVDAAVLADARQDGQCHIHNGSAIAAETAKRITCDGAVRPLVHDEAGKLLDLGRRARCVSPALRRALEARDGGCTFPGCTHQHRLHAHHVLHWANGGETNPANTILLCGLHHFLVHEGGFGVTLAEDETPIFTRPDTTVLPPQVGTQPLADGQTGSALLRARSAGEGLEITAESCPPPDGGGPLDLDWTLAVLMPLLESRSREHA